MNGKTVEDQHITRVDLALYPVIAANGIQGDFGNVEIFFFVRLNPVPMRPFEDAQGASLNRAIMEGYPHGVKLRISSHELVVLVSMSDEAFATGKDETADRLRVYQNLVAGDHLHYLLQRGMMRQGMKLLQVEHFLVGFLEYRVRVTVGRAFSRYTVQRRTARAQPSLPGENLADIRKN